MSWPSVPPFTPRVQYLGLHGLYLVESRTTIDAWYAVDVEDYTRPTCDCPAGQEDFAHCRRTPWCWHVSAARLHDALSPCRTLAAYRQGLAALQTIVEDAARAA